MPILSLPKMSKAQVKLAFEAEGFKQRRLFDDLPWQHLFVFVKPWSRWSLVAGFWPQDIDGEERDRA